MRFLIIVNPVSGLKKGEEILQKVQPGFEKNAISFTSIVTEYAGHPFDIAVTYDLSSIDAIAIIGGDGTMHEVINGMMGREDKIRIPIGLITGGTGNSLMHDLNALNPMDAANRIFEGNLLSIDLARVRTENKDIYAFNVIGWGLPATINKKAEKWRIFKNQRYNIASLVEIIRNPKWKVKIQLDDREILGSYSFFLACNTIFSGKGMKVAPLAKLDDGFFDIVMLQKASRRKLVRLFAKIFKGNHVKDPLVQYHQVSNFAITDIASGDLIIDGQLLGKAPFEVVVLKNEIEIFI